jgi:lipopolysaccharide export system permease protein
MLLFDRYILKQFFAAMLVSIAGFIIIYVAVDMMEKLDKFLDKGVPALHVLEYYVNFTPQIIALILPVGLLLGSLFATGKMSTTNEIVAMRSAGMSLYRLMLPFVAAATLLSASAIYFDGWILPRANARVFEILREYGIESSANNAESNLYMQESATTLVAIGDFSIVHGKASRVSIEYFDPRNSTRLVRRIDAPLMTWDSVHRNWWLTDATERTFTSDTLAEHIHKLPPQQSRMEFTFTPAALREREMKMEEMTNTELARRIDLKMRSGQDVARDEVDYYGRVAMAFTGVIVVLFGVPFASKKKRGGLSFEFSIAIFISFIFLAFSKIAQTFGYTGETSPVTAAWLANILFFIGSLFIVWKAQK